MCACSNLRKEAIPETSDDESDVRVDSGREDFYLKEFKKTAKKQKTTEEVSGQSNYINFNFITGSAAVVEGHSRGVVVCIQSQLNDFIPKEE